MEIDTELNNIRTEFRNLRQRKGKTTFPTELKNRVVLLLRNGCPIVKLCETCDLYRSQVHVWQTKFQETKNQYEVRKIPVVQPRVEIPNVMQIKNSKPKLFFRFYSLKIVWR